MSVIEAKNQLRVLSTDQRREIVAFLFDLQDEENEAAELTQLHAEMDAGRRVSLVF